MLEGKSKEEVYAIIQAKWFIIFNITDIYYKDEEKAEDLGGILFSIWIKLFDILL